MRKLIWISRRLLTALAALGAACLVIAGSSVAGPKPNGSYLATTKKKDVTFTISVSGDGKKISHVGTLLLPAFCPAAPVVAHTDFKPGKISKNDHFETDGKEYDFNGQVAGHAKLTGHFLSKKKISGEFQVTYSAMPGCGGTDSYTAKLVQLGLPAGA